MSSMSSPPNYHEREAPEHLDEMTCMLYLERQLERTRALEAPKYRPDQLPEVDRAKVALDTPHSTFGKILTELQLARV